MKKVRPRTVRPLKDVRVRWVDHSHGEEGWHSLKDIEHSKSYGIKTHGTVISKNDEAVIICQNIDDEEKIACNYIEILFDNILEMWVLPE